MAQVKNTIKNGQSVTGLGAATETQIIPDDVRATIIFFQVTTGTLQVTVGTEGQENFITSEIFSFGTTHGINQMRIENSKDAEIATNRRVVYIQGTGTAYFTW